MLGNVHADHVPMICLVTNEKIILIRMQKVGYDPNIIFYFIFSKIKTLITYFFFQHNNIINVQF